MECHVFYNNRASDFKIITALMVSETGSSFFTEGHVEWWTHGYLSAIYTTVKNVYVTHIICACKVHFQTELGV